MTQTGRRVEEGMIAGLSPTDRLLGMLVERTEALRDETAEMRKATDGLKLVSTELRLTLESVLKRTDRLEKNDEALEKHALRIQSLEDERDSRRRATATLSSVLGAVGGSVASFLWQWLHGR